jgi:hypothetical protein
MTVRSLKPSLELDELVAVHVMAYEARLHETRSPIDDRVLLRWCSWFNPRASDENFDNWFWYMVKDERFGRPWEPHQPRWSPSSNIVAAWRVVQRMLDHPDQSVYLAFIAAMNEAGWCAPEHIVCVRICCAALAAVGVTDLEVSVNG